jgi:hypothetical protein
MQRVLDGNKPNHEHASPIRQTAPGRRVTHPPNSPRNTPLVSASRSSAPSCWLWSNAMSWPGCACSRGGGGGAHAWVCFCACVRGCVCATHTDGMPTLKQHGTPQRNATQRNAKRGNNAPHRCESCTPSPLPSGCPCILVVGGMVLNGMVLDGMG